MTIDDITRIADAIRDFPYDSYITDSPLYQEIKQLDSDDKTNLIIMLSVYVRNGREIDG